MREVAIALVFAIAGWMLRTYLTHVERMKELAITTRGLGASEARLVRVEQAVESIAVEVERIGEGQRFVTGLLKQSGHPALEAVGNGPAAHTRAV